MTEITQAKLDEMLAGLEGVTPGPWEVIEEEHEWSLPERAMMGHDMPAQSGEHLELRIFTAWEHPQAKSPWPVVNSSVGIGKAGEPSIQMVWMEPAVAAHIARCDPDTMRQIITLAKQALSQPITTEVVEVRGWEGYWPGAGSIDSVTSFTRFRETMERWVAEGAEITPLYALTRKE